MDGLAVDPIAESETEDSHHGEEELDGSEIHPDDLEYRELKKKLGQGIRKVDGCINDIWTKRVWVSTLLNVSLIGSALYNGFIFVIAIITTAILHVVDKYLDFDIHKLYQEKDYIKNGY